MSERIRLLIDNAEPIKDPVEELVQRLNEEFMVVNEHGKTMVYQTSYDSLRERKYHQRLQFKDFLDLYCNQRIEVGRDSNKKPIYQPAGKVWKEHTKRKQFLKGVVFDPSNKEQDGVLNLWQGFAVKAQAGGSWDRLIEHVHDIICRRNEANFDYLMSWMARLVQRPAEMGEVAVVMRGEQGVGKGILANALRRIIGPHAMRISESKHLTGNFNLHLRDLVFLFADEAFFAGDKANVGVLKSLITEDTLTIEGKHMNAYEARNYLHLMMASNNEWVVPAELTDRRFFMLDVGNGKRRDYPYFQQIWDELGAGGFAAMLDFLMSFDLSEFNVREVPETEALQEQKQLSLPLELAWWQDCLHRGYVYQSKYNLPDFDEWHEELSTDLLHASYDAYAKRLNHRHPMHRNMFGKFMQQKIGAMQTRPRNVLTGEERDIHGQDWPIRKQKPAYRLGTLDDARENFCHRTRLHIDWPPSAQGAQG
jgi:hypothetical protein